jgi:hypothetical protein
MGMVVDPSADYNGGAIASADFRSPHFIKLLGPFGWDSEVINLTIPFRP